MVINKRISKINLYIFIIDKNVNLKLFGNKMEFYLSNRIFYYYGLFFVINQGQCFVFMCEFIVYWEVDKLIQVVVIYFSVLIYIIDDTIGGNKSWMFED